MLLTKRNSYDFISKYSLTITTGARRHKGGFYFWWFVSKENLRGNGRTLLKALKDFYSNNWREIE